MRVLLVDDDMISRGLRTALLRLCGYEIVAAADAPHAHDFAAESRFDAVIVDRPGKFDALSLPQLKRADGTPKILALVDTALDMQRAQAADRIISSPASPLEVVNALRSILPS